MRTGGRILVDQLELNGADLAFCLPGESYLPVLDALYDSPIRLVTCRHEQGAANAAEAYGKLTGRPGICLVTRGPGATQAAVGVHTAKQDSSPMLLLVGQVPRAFRGREAWQELDYAQVFGGIAKAAWEVDSAERIPEHMAEAYSIALSGRPGPVVLALPEDVLAEQADVADGAAVAAPRQSPSASDLARLRELLAAAERPLVVVGEGGWTAETSRDVQAFCEENELPVACAFRCQDYVDNRSSSYVGVLGVAMEEAIAARLRDADVVLAIGGRLGEVPTRRYTLLEPPDPRQILVHVHPDPSELGRVYLPDLAIAATLPEAAHALRELAPVEPRWQEWTAAARADYEANLVNEPMEGNVDLGEVMAFLRRRLPGDSVQTCGAGNFTVWAHRFAAFTEFGTQACPRSGSMGYGLPAAVAAQLVHPDRVVVCFTGDGDFVMSSPELATAVQYGLPIVILLVNNGMYATIRMHQERTYPRRVIGTDLANPDFPALARAYGAHGERIERTEDFEGAFERALASGKPSVLELPVDPERISPRVKLSELRGEA
ncbi:MAG TPA: thiamine pyrophosphate-binding protein [Gaiellaceae bacterium]|jgi:acetolactate synthase-1/2/3 large subunit|nr:thiamine pyrophosphate-binding protein [Gaiellaceae bacterium]